ncbi:L-rhamnose mutarotase [Mycolicibacterium komossense]|uniref:L-rhamnose mutarotase n=1 Tax=Mycolicibacterium komossense TaxID=1779 RepID=A0ABT3C9X9_9MYCO|nr:L-rhamnose mutarotase [Mycolicibacterium komossense]MCV7226285.1 L-rhamnose mutarotase [Mycolicibacterium komossense]
MSGATTQRVCFLLQLKPDRVEDYLQAHQEVWPEMLEALRAAGWGNYSLFLRPADGLVVGYLETDDFALAQQRMAQTEINAKWQAGMAQYFVGGSQADPDEQITPLAEYFHLA